MSRVHDALRRAEQLPETPATGLVDNGANGAGTGDEPDSLTLVVPETEEAAELPATIVVSSLRGGSNGLVRAETKELQVDWRNLLLRCRAIPFHPAPEAHLIDIDRP